MHDNRTGMIIFPRMHSYHGFQLFPLSSPAFSSIKASALETNLMLNITLPFNVVTMRGLYVLDV